MSFGTKVKEYRIRYGMNKKTFADRVGIHPDHLRRIEKDETNPPNAKTLARMVEVLRLSAEEAFTLLNEAKD